MQVLTKRNLVLANLVLFLVFLACAYAASRPLLHGGPDIAIAPSDDQGAEPVAPNDDQKAYESMGAVYPRLLALNNLFVPKIPFVKEAPPEQHFDPYEPPKWELVGIWQPEGTYYEANINDARRREVIQVRKGARFPEYKLIVQDVTADQVICMASEPECNNRKTMLYLTERGLKTAPVVEAAVAAEAKDWSTFITTLRPGYYVVDMNEFEKECRETAGSKDWIEFLIASVKAQPYKPNEEDPDGLGGYKIVSFEPESPLDDFGLQVNDIILGVNRDEITGRSQARQMLREILTNPTGGKFELMFERATKNQRIVIELQRF